MNKFSFIAYIFAVTLFMACSDSGTDNGNAEPQPVEVATPANVKSFDGVERVKLLWEQPSQGNVAKSVVYWNERKSYKTLTFKAQNVSGMQKDSIFIDRLDEGDYTFEIVNVDKDNNQSAFKSIAAHAYGDAYIAELETRPTESLSYDKESRKATITWGEEWSEGLGTEVSNDSKAEDAPATAWVKNSDLTTEISPLDDGAKLKIQTLYCPDNCIDTMRSAAVTLTVKAPESGDEGGEGNEGEGDEGNEEDTRPLTAPANAMGKDGFKRVQLSWEQTIDSSIDKTIILWGLTEDQKCEKPFERKEQSGTQTEEIIIDLPEGEYTFSIVNVNKAGDKTEAVEVKARAYGDNFVATLATRAVTEFSYNASGRSASLTLGAASADKGMANTRAVYRHVTTGEQVSKTIRNSASTTTCDNIGPSEQIEIFSVYRFDNCIDDIYSKSIFKTTDHLIDVKVMQFNVKNSSSSLAERCKQIADLVKAEGVDVMGLQELYCGLNQNGSEALDKLLAELGSNYGGILYQRTASPWDYEGEAIVYRKDKYTIVNSGRFWLTSTPDNAGKTSVDGYTAKYERFAIWSVLKDKNYGKELCFTTTHIDNSNLTADEKAGFPIMTYQVKVMVDNAQARSGSVDSSNRPIRPIIIVGDFNANPDKSPIKAIKDKGYSDTYDLAKTKNYPSGGESVRGTMHNNGVPNYSAFDYIFTRGGNLSVSNHTIHPAARNSVTLSDHLAVTAEICYQVSAE